MELTELRDKIIATFTGSKSDLADVLAMVEQDQSIFPFNEYEHLICNLIDRGGMSYQKSDGYWVHNQEEIVFVPLIDGMEEKSNHDLAKQIILKKYPKYVIDKVYEYC